MKKILALLLCIVMFSCSVNVYSFSLAPLDTEDGEAMYEFFVKLMKTTENQYRFGITYEELLDAAVKKVITENPEMFAQLAKGAYEALDENSAYLTTEEYEERLADTLGQFAGIGVSVMEDDGQVIIVNPMDDTPAKAAGLMAGDIIISVDGEDVTSYGIDKTTSIIRGEEGTAVTIGVLRNDSVMEFTMERAIIKQNPVVYEKLEKNNAGYVQITSFNANTSEYFKAALDDLNSQGFDKIILDLRNNPGGLITEAINIASYFVPDNSLVVTESYKDESRDILHYSNPTDYKFKVVVLVNEYSASASEIVSGTINDYDAGPLVGVTTYGKGTVQTVVRLKNLDAMWLTIAQYNLPKGENIHKIGIEPDYYVENVYESADYTKLTKLNPSRQIKLGDMGDDVLAVEERLSLLGYNISKVDNVYDEETYTAITKFQKAAELYPYGVADYTTQNKLQEVLRSTKFLNDRQHTKALELIYEMK